MKYWEDMSSCVVGKLRVGKSIFKLAARRKLLWLSLMEISSF